MLRELADKCAVLFRRRTLFTVSVVSLIAVILICIVSSPAIVGASATTRQLPIYSVARDDKAAALTFDAAWGNEDTQQLIDILAKYDVTATFFVTGGWVSKFPESVKALHDAGHLVMNHSNDHAHFCSISASQIIDNINACSDKIEAVTGVRPWLFRCPYGEYDDNVIATINGMGVKTIQWDVDSLDWKDLSASDITSRVLKRVGPGSIILFHNAAKNTPAALPGIIESLIADGYSLVSVDALLLTGEYTIDHTGRQQPG
jgi:polysaccharide deacetylase family sporulation protein PdaB